MNDIIDIIKEMREYLTNIGPGERIEEDVIADFADRIEKEAKSECRDCEIAKSEARLRNEVPIANQYWEAKYIKQGEVMAETARQNVRLCKELAKYKKVIELAGCLTNMSLVEDVHYKATHQSFKFDPNLHIALLHDPIMHQYTLLEEQMVPVFKMLKEAVADVRKSVMSKLSVVSNNWEKELDSLKGINHDQTLSNNPDRA